MTTQALVPVPPIPTPLARPIDFYVELGRSAMQESKAPRTRYAYADDWKQFVRTAEDAPCGPHGDMFKILQDQMTTFVPGVAAPREDITKRGWTSPDRMDALVWGVHELFLKDVAYPDYSMFTRELRTFPTAPIPPRLRPWWMG